MALRSGSELVLVAEVPRAGDRWHQVHLNVDIGSQFFRVRPEQQEELVTLQLIDSAGAVLDTVTRSLVFSQANRNYRLEFNFGQIANYPSEGPPLLVVLETGTRHFKYVALMPWDTGYQEMLSLNQTLPSIGKGRRRVITTLDEIEMRWPNCPLVRTL